MAGSVKKDMSRAFFVLSTLAFILVCYFGFGWPKFGQEPARAATVTWDGGGGDNLWETAANWDGDTLPTNADDVIIVSSTASLTVTLSGGQTADFATLTIGGDGTQTAGVTLEGNIGTGGSITIDNNGTLTQKNTVTQSLSGELYIKSGGNLTHTDNTTDQLYEVDFSVASSTIAAGGSIDVDGKGYSGGGATSDGNGTGGGTYGSGPNGAGGGHAGNGGADDEGDKGGVGYCDISNPSTIGSGGAGTSLGAILGGDGGGLIQIAATGDITISGTITADGANGTRAAAPTRDSGAGAGGGVNLSANSILGTPESFTISGGGLTIGAISPKNGTGGGGCALLSYVSINEISAVDIDMAGGLFNGIVDITSDQRGGAGVVLLKQSGSNGDLYSINAGKIGSNKSTVESTLSTTNLTLDNIIVASSSIFTVTSTQTLTFADGDPFTSADSSATTGTLRIAGGGKLTTVDAFSIKYGQLEIFSTGNWTNSSTLDLTLVSNGILSLGSYTTTTDPFTINSLLVDSGGVLTQVANGSTQEHVLNFSTPNLTVNAGGSINVDGKGYAGGIGPTDGNGPTGGAGVYNTADDGSGGAHGGGGGADAQADAGGTAYCVASNPGTVGAGGGGNAAVAGYGGAGGGLIFLNISNTLTINGEISADGGEPNDSGTYHGGGGGGGGMNITAGTLAGTPSSFTAVGSSADTQGGGGGGGCVYMIYTISSSVAEGDVSVAGGGGANSGATGDKTIVQDNTAPTATAISPTQNGSSNSIVTITTTVADADSNVTSLILEYSTDNITWVSSTLRDVTQAGGEGDGVVTSTGSITDIDTDNDGSVDLTIEWNITDDLSTDQYNNVYFRVIPNDGITNGSTVTSGSFLVDRKAPIGLGSLTVGTVTYASASLNFGAQASDTNFEEYKIYYKAGSSGVTESDSVHTSSTDVNLGSFNYGGASNTTLDGLNANTQYFVNIWAYDDYGNSAVASEEADFTTLASGATTPTVNNPSVSTLDITINESGNPSNTTFSIYNETDGVYVGADGSSSPTAVYQTTSTWGGAVTATGFSVNTGYQFSVVARNGAEVDSATSTANNLVYTLANVPGSFTATGNGTEQINTSWTANGNPSGTQYNITMVGGTSSGWITGLSHAFTDLTPSTVYSFTLKARNANSVETASVAASATTDSIGVGTTPGGGGTGDPAVITPPECVGEECCTDELCTELQPSGLAQIYFCGAPTGEYINAKDLEECDEENLELVLNVQNVTLLAIKPTNKIGDFDFSGISFESFASPQYYGLRNDSNCFSVRFHGEGGTLDRFACVILDTETINPVVRGINTQKYARKLNNVVSSRPTFSGEAEPHSIITLSFSQPSDFIANSLAFYNSMQMAGFFTFNTKAGDFVINQDSFLPQSYSLAVKLTSMLLKTAGFTYAQMADDTYTIETNDIGIWNFESPIYVDQGEQTIYLQSEDLAGNISDWVSYSFVVTDVLQQCGNGIIEEGEECDEGDANGAVFTACNGSCQLWRSCTEVGDGSVVLETSVDTAQYPFDGQISCSPYFEGYTYFKCEDNPVSFLGHEYDIDTVGYVTVNQTCTANEECKNASCVPKTFICGDGVCEGTENLISCPADCGFISRCGNGICDPETESCESCSADCGVCSEELPEEEPEEEPKEEPEEEPETEKNEEENIVDEVNKIIENFVERLGGSDFIPESVKATARAIRDVSEVIFDDIKKQIIEPVFKIAKETYKQVQKVIDNPQVEKVNEKILAPTIVVAGAANVAVGFQFPSLLTLLRYLFSQPLLWFRRRKQKGWGIVYNAFTKQPLDLATVRIIDSQTEKVARTQVTDKEGRYFLVLNPGIYKIEVTKVGFDKGSELLEGKKEDDKFRHLYHVGETIKITEEKSEVNYNVPLDPIGENKPTNMILKEHARKIMQETGSLVGLGVSVTSFIISPTPLIGGLVVVHTAFYGVFRILAHGRMPEGAGSVVDQKNGEPLDKVVVRVFDSAYNKLVNTVITDRKGKYGVLVGPSKYYVTYDKPGYEEKQSGEIDLSSEKTNGIGGVITRDEKLVKMGKGNGKKAVEAVEVTKVLDEKKLDEGKVEGVQNVQSAKGGPRTSSGDVENEKEIEETEETTEAVEMPEKPKLKTKIKEKVNVVKEKVTKKKKKNVKFEEANLKKEKPSEAGLNVEDMMAGDEPDNPAGKNEDIFG